MDSFSKYQKNKIKDNLYLKNYSYGLVPFRAVKSES